MAQLALGLCLLCLALALIALAVFRFAVTTLADPRYEVNYDQLVQAADFFPNNAPLQARVAAELVEKHWDSAADYQESATEGVDFANRAIVLTPRNFENHLLAAHAYEAQGDLNKAAEVMQLSLQLAPNHTSVHWQYANLLLRLGRLPDALPSFRKVVKESPEKIPAIYQLVWQASQGDLMMMHSIAQISPQAQLSLANFLVSQQRYSEAIASYQQVEKAFALSSAANAQPIDALLAARQWIYAGALWQGLFKQGTPDAHNVLWNGGWETQPVKSWNQFDWQINGNKYASFGIVNGQAHSGRASLQMVYQKIDTTTLTDNVKQLCLVQPQSRYRLEGFIKKEKLLTPDGAFWVVLNPETNEMLASSAPITSGTTDWQPLTMDFAVPANVHAVILALRQAPQLKYTDPSSGTVWFDDFKIQTMP